MYKVGNEKTMHKVRNQKEIAKAKLSMMHCGEGYGSEGNVKETYYHTR